MEKLIEIYNEVFPKTSVADWFYALLGLFLHIVVKLKNISFKRFKWRVFLGEFIPVWHFSILSVAILVGTLPLVMDHFNTLDAALIGYSSSSIFKQLFKSRTGNLNVL
ncbi:MAG: hypothetical protein ACXVNO_00225 [Bacteroidia bacterium]